MEIFPVGTLPSAVPVVQAGHVLVGPLPRQRYQDFSVQWNGTTIFSETNNLDNTLVPISIDPVATGSSTTFAFFGRNLLAPNVLGEVRVVPAVPVPPVFPAPSPVLAFPA